METKKVLILLGGGVGVAWGAAYLFAKWNEHAFTTMGDRGTFGDSFGAFNAVVSGLGFAAVAYSLYRQQKQISDDKGERREQADQVKRQVTAMHAQAAAMAKLAAAMSADAELARLLAEYDLVHKRIELQYEEMPLRFTQDFPNIRKSSYEQLDKMINEYRGSSDETERTFGRILSEVRALRERRRLLYLRLTSEDRRRHQ